MASTSYPKETGFKENFKRNRHKSESDFVIRKRLPPRSEKRPGDVYVTNKSNFKGQIAECMKLIENPQIGEVTLKGLGAAIPRTINLALQIKEKAGEQYVMDTKTSTVRLTDDLEGVPDVTEQKRDNSAISIRIYKSS